MKIDHNGEELCFWYCLAGQQAAKRQGYDFDQAEEGAKIETAADFTENIMRFLWICYLPFEPEITFEVFSMAFTVTDYAKLGEAYSQVIEQQLDLAIEDEEEKEPKKAKGRAKKK